MNDFFRASNENVQLMKRHKKRHGRKSRSCKSKNALYVSFVKGSVSTLLLAALLFLGAVPAPARQVDEPKACACSSKEIPQPTCHHATSKACPCHPATCSTPVPLTATMASATTNLPGVIAISFNWDSRNFSAQTRNEEPHSPPPKSLT
jgi:hypothetical protein